MENSSYNPVNHDQPEHHIMEQLVRASSLHNNDAEDFHYWEANLKKVEVELKYLTSKPDELMNQITTIEMLWISIRSFSLKYH